VLDCKKEAATSTFEMAKDIAAFANHLGGTLLIGAIEQGEVLRQYHGVPSKITGQVITDYQTAVANRCWPRPVIDPELYQHPSDSTKNIIALNVQPSLDLVSVSLKGDKAFEGYGGDAYVFPVRSGNLTRYLIPGQIAMFMTPQIRRVAVMIARIPSHATVNIVEERINTFKGTRTLQSHERRFVTLSEEDNLVTFLDAAPSEAAHHIPLDLIRSVYRDANGKWQIVTDLYR
jgi:hypothetical protein